MSEDQNQLQLIVQQSGLESAKAQTLLDQFQDYFRIAAEWEGTAKALIVTDETQTGKMAMAREGRLFLRQKRIDVEHSRKELKEQIVREGKAIDGIANILKALIVPIEEHLGKQENFVKLKEAEEARLAQIEADRIAEEKRLAAEKAEREERERIRQDNDRLRLEAEKKERELVAERERVAKERDDAEAEAEAVREKLQEESERKLAKERAAAERKQAAATVRLNAQKEAAAAKLKKEKEAAQEKLRKTREDLKAKADAKLEAQKAAQKKLLFDEKQRALDEINAERKNQEKLEEQLSQIGNIEVECPNCHHKFVPEVSDGRG